jgi:hypothetical protein
MREREPSVGGSGPEPSISERFGSTVIMCVGIALIVATIACAFTRHQLAAGGLAPMGLLACIAAMLIDRMEGDFSILGFHGKLRATTTRWRIEAPGTRDGEVSQQPAGPLSGADD